MSDQPNPEFVRRLVFDIAKQIQDQDTEGDLTYSAWADIADDLERAQREASRIAESLWTEREGQP